MACYPRLRGRMVQYLVCVCVCVCVCLSVCYHKIAVNFNYLKIKLGNLRQKVVLYKTGKFLQASVARVVFKFGKKKNQLYRSYTKDFSIKLKTLFYLKLKIRKK